MKLQIAIFILLLAVLLISGCTTEETGPAISESEIELACIQLCQNAFNMGQDLSKGPCLSDDDPDWTIENWVCDVAHSPRQEVDNDPANQCQDYREGRARHFIEVDPDCNLIKSV